MVIDARNLFINRYSQNTSVYRARSEDEYKALVSNLEKSGEKRVQILQDYELSGGDGFDGFWTDHGQLDSHNNIVGALKEVVFSLAYQQDYTAEDAFYNSYTSSVYGSYSTSAVKDNTVIGMNEEEFLGYIRENGLDKEIDWNSVYVNLRGKYEFDSLTDYTNYASALYASLEDRIYKDFSGDKLNEQLDILNSKFETAIRETQDFYVDEITECFEKLGVDISADELKESVRELMIQKRDAYCDYVKNNSDYANLENSEDKWLERDVGYMANALRNSFDPTSEIEGGEYSEKDLIAIGYAANVFKGYTSGLSGITCDNEESLGLCISMAYLTLNEGIDKLGGGDKVMELAEKALDGYAEGLIKTKNDSLAKQRSAYTEKKYAGAFEAVDKSAVYNVLEHMKAVYESTKDATESINSTVRFAYEQFKATEKDSTLWRYGTSDNLGRGGNFWNKMYDSGQGGTTYINKIFDRWSKISNALESQNLYTLSLYGTASSFQSYATIKTVNITGGYANGKWYGTNLLDYVQSR